MPPTETTVPLPPGIAIRHVPGVNGLAVSVLEAGDPAHPAILLLHGFPELGYSWRKIMGPLAAAGYHVLAPDQRGFGATTGWNGADDSDPQPFRLLNLARDAFHLLRRMGHDEAALVAGHDFGAAVAATAALARPESVRRLALMSAPFAGPPAIPLAIADGPDPIHSALAALPRPRKHYQNYFATRHAVQHMDHPPQGMHAFLRGYYHVKSADWPGNDPHELPGWTADALAAMPTYYVMDLASSMPETVLPTMPARPAPWLTEAELAVYAAAFKRTGFGGGLHWYRCRAAGLNADLDLYAGRTLPQPAAFIAGAQDWGVHQVPGALAAMQRFVPAIRLQLIEGAGHWVQQEQPGAVIQALLALLARP